MSDSSEIIKKWWEIKDTYSLCKSFFEVEITLGQSQIVREVAFGDHNRVLIVCLTRYGKSYCVSMGLLLWILRNIKRKVALIAPTNEKTGIIRNYISYFIAKSPMFSQLLDIEKTGIERIRKEVSRKRMTFKNGVELRTLSAEGQGSALKGFGADKVIVDEECDINYEVYRSKITRMLGDNKDSEYLGIGNPWHRNNQMWQHMIDPKWHKIHIGWKQAVQEGRVSQEFIDEQRSQLSEMEFKVLYEAEFPDTAEDALIDWVWIDASLKRKEEWAGELVAGFDVAEMGKDSSVLTIGMKNKELNKYKATEVFSWNKMDLMPTVGKILLYYEKYPFTRITVDATGVGSGVYSRLEELKREGKIKCQVIAFKGGMSPEKEKERERFLNLKAEAYWHLRKIFEEGKISILPHKTLIDQLSKMKWELTSSEKIRIRDPGTKEGDTAEEKSPDFSDSLNLMCWEGSRTGLVFFGASLARDKDVQIQPKKT